MPTYTYRDTAGRIKLGPIGSTRDTSGRIKIGIPQARTRDTSGRILLQLAQLAVQRTSLDGINVSFVAANLGGNAFANDGRVWIELSNSSGSTRTVTFKSQRPCDQGILHDDVVPVLAGADRLRVGPFLGSRFNDARQMVQMSYSSVTGLTIAAVSPP